MCFLDAENSREVIRDVLGKPRKAQAVRIFGHYSPFKIMLSKVTLEINLHTGTEDGREKAISKLETFDTWQMYTD